MAATLTLPSLRTDTLLRAARLVRWAPTLLVLIPWLVGPAQTTTVDRVAALSSRAEFHLLDWEAGSLLGRAGQLWTELTSGRPAPGDPEVVRAYFAAPADQREPLRAPAEAAVDSAIADVYLRGGVGSGDRLFPPVLVALTSPPEVLVVSPRTALRVDESILLRPLPVAQQEALESSADSTGVSSLVAPIGGIATFPSKVVDSGSPAQVISSAAHEWVHHYLIFYPLGLGYFSSQETREINETTADLIGNEVGAQAARDLGLPGPPAPGPRVRAPSAQPTFDFTAFMRETRLQVEQFLAQGQVDQAEAYMEKRRLEVNQHGYAIRKLNQAYFAFYGSYTGGFAASPRNPVPGYLRRLRADSPTLGAFLDRVRTITTVAQLRAAVGA